MRYPPTFLIFFASAAGMYMPIAFAPSETLIHVFEFGGHFLLICQHLVELEVQVVNDELAFEVYAVVVLGALAVFGLLTVLAHHEPSFRREAGRICDR